MSDERDRSRSFGFAPVEPDEKQTLVNDVFARVADRYDLMNDIMSGGLHRLWKDDLITWLSPPRSSQPFTLLDVAGGTGDVATRFLKAAGGGARCILCDISADMLRVGQRRTAGAGMRHIRFVQGNGEALPIADASVDAYSIAFGIRNVTHLERALQEAFRVLRPGGRFLCLEFSDVQVPWLDAAYERYSFAAIPTIGAFVAGSAAPYRYLVESIQRFPDQDSFAELIAAAGFEQVKYRNLSGGIAALHSGWRL
ncbi:MAG: bifunctional demethylmenaquinone methyltransferase/2-methoxy-6-polyprenyl-1,4-benzoquinol methylase UbiE [Methyloligellaceae bacterium]